MYHKTQEEELAKDLKKIRDESVPRNGVIRRENAKYHHHEHNSLCESEMSELQSLWIDDFETDFNNYKLETYHKVYFTFLYIFKIVFAGLSSSSFSFTQGIRA